jgi:[ribosomal protein S18]-alanine N-acetyltransferase
MTSPAGPADDARAAPDVVITPMRRRHLRGVLRIESQTQARGWSLGLFLGELARPDDRVYLVAKVGSQVVGFGGMLFIGTDGHVTTLSVDPGWRRLGIATGLLSAMCRQAIDVGITALTLEVRAHNPEAQALYRAFGFAPAGVRRNYYAETGEDALVMWVHDVDQEDYARRLDVLEASAACTARVERLDANLTGPAVGGPPAGRLGTAP